MAFARWKVWSIFNVMLICWVYSPFNTKHQLKIAWNDGEFIFSLNGADNTFSHIFWCQCWNPSEMTFKLVLIFVFIAAKCVQHYLELTSSNMPVDWIKYGQMHVVWTLLPSNSNSKRRASSKPTAANLLLQ